MRLSDKQALFAVTMTKFETWIESQGWKYVRGEALRSRAEARRLAKLGKGITNSVHCLKLAQDLFVFGNDNDPWNDDEIYRMCAEKWVSMHDFCRAGYFFKGGVGRDAVHFSFIHNGVQ